MLGSSSEKVADAIAKLIGIVREFRPEPEIKQKVQAQIAANFGMVRSETESDEL